MHSVRRQCTRIFQDSFGEIEKYSIKIFCWKRNGVETVSPICSLKISASSTIFGSILATQPLKDNEVPKLPNQAPPELMRNPD
ncbi:MAG: hypothetical protein CSA33_03325 [Desulfobulbus propionicus]|nr:MAG: hypothetical protein CSA33_03325 [Desulfobulbus propionicus]